MKQWEQDYKEASTVSSSSAGEIKMELKALEEKQARLLDAYLEQTITNEEYTETKKKLLNRKIEIKENLKESAEEDSIGSNFHIIGQKAALELGFPWAAASGKSRFSVWSR